MDTMCFTDPRPAKLFGYDREKYIPVHDALVQVILKTYEAGVRNYISGGAQGFDQLAFWSADFIRNVSGLVSPGSRHAAVSALMKTPRLCRIRFQTRKGFLPSHYRVKRRNIYPPAL